MFYLKMVGLNLLAKVSTNISANETAFIILMGVMSLTAPVTTESMKYSSQNPQLTNNLYMSNLFTSLRSLEPASDSEVSKPFLNPYKILVSLPLTCQVCWF